MHCKTILTFAAMAVLWPPGTSRSANDDARPALAVAETFCEYAVNPLGIDAAQPRFTWVLGSDRRGTMQQAYQVLVASSPEQLAADTGDLWDSGKVASDESVNIVYQGKKLSSRQQCFWKVRVWDDQGTSQSVEQAGHVRDGIAGAFGLARPVDRAGRRQHRGRLAAAAKAVRRRRADQAGQTLRGRHRMVGILSQRKTRRRQRARSGDDRLRQADSLRHPRRHRPAAAWPQRAGRDARQRLVQPAAARQGLWRLAAPARWNWSSNWPTARSSGSPATRAGGHPPVRSCKNDLWGGEVYDARLEKTGWTGAGLRRLGLGRRGREGIARRTARSPNDRTDQGQQGPASR